MYIWYLHLYIYIMYILYVYMICIYDMYIWYVYIYIYILYVYMICIYVYNMYIYIYSIWHQFYPIKFSNYIHFKIPLYSALHHLVADLRRFSQVDRCLFWLMRLAGDGWKPWGYRATEHIPEGPYGKKNIVNHFTWFNPHVRKRGWYMLQKRGLNNVKLEKDKGIWWGYGWETS